MSDAPNFWEGNVPYPESPTHQFAIWLSLDSLESFWRPFPVFARNLPALRAGARQALHDYHKGDATSVETAFFEAVSNDVSGEDVNQVKRFIEAFEAMDKSFSFGWWGGWVSMNQHRPHIPGFDPTKAHLLMKAYREEVVHVDRELEADLSQRVAEAPLSDWDMFIHRTYGYCYHQTDRFDTSIVLNRLYGVRRSFLLNAYLVKHLLPLSDAERQLMLDAVREEWRASLAEPPHNELDALFMRSNPGPDPSTIKPVSEIVQWL